MFFEDRVGGLRQMMRVLRPGGRLAVAVWATLENSPGFAELARLVERHCGTRPAEALRVPFALGDTGELASLARRAGLVDWRIETLAGVARFASITDWIRTEVRGWSYSELVDDEAQRPWSTKRSVRWCASWPPTAASRSTRRRIVSATRPRDASGPGGPKDFGPPEFPAAPYRCQPDAAAISRAGDARPAS